MISHKVFCVSLICKDCISLRRKVYKKKKKTKPEGPNKWAISVLSWLCDKKLKCGTCSYFWLLTKRGSGSRKGRGRKSKAWSPHSLHNNILCSTNANFVFGKNFQKHCAPKKRSHNNIVMSCLCDNSRVAVGHFYLPFTQITLVVTLEWPYTGGNERLKIG